MHNTQFIIRKTETNPKGILGLDEVTALIKKEIISKDNLIIEMSKDILILKEEIKNLKNKEMTKDSLIKLLFDESNFNISNLSILSNNSIEKNKNIKSGSIYYDPKNKIFRVNIDGKWTNLKT